MGIICTPHNLMAMFQNNLINQTTWERFRGERHVVKDSGSCVTVWLAQSVRQVQGG